MTTSVREAPAVIFLPRIAMPAALMMCLRTDDDTAPAEPTLHRDYFGMHRFEWHKEDGSIDGIEFHLTHGDMFRLLRSCGFEVQDLLEVQAPADVTSHVEADVPLEWARRRPRVEMGRPGRPVSRTAR